MYRLLATAALTVALLPAGAEAQIPIDPNCPPTAWCHPDGDGMGGVNGFMDGMTDAADAVGRALQDYECKGGLDCLGVAMRDLMCAIDGREIAQIACGGGGGGGDGGGSGGGDGDGAKPDDPGSTGNEAPGDAPAQPDSSATTQVQTGTLALRLQGYRANGLRTMVQRARVGSALRMDVPGMRFTLKGKFARNPENPTEFFAVVEAAARGLQATDLVVFVDRRGTRVVHGSAFRSVRRGD